MNEEEKFYPEPEPAEEIPEPPEAENPAPEEAPETPTPEIEVPETPGSEPPEAPLRRYPDSFYDTAKQSFSKTAWAPLIMIGATIGIELLFGIGLVVKLLLEGTLTAPDFLEDELFNLFLSTVPMYLAGLPLAWLSVRKMPKVNRAKHSLGVGQFLKYFPVCIAAIYGGVLVSNLIESGISWITDSYPVYEVGELVSSIPYWSVIVITVIAAPIAEELLFRKFLIDRLQQYGTKLVIVFSGVSFGLFHGNLTQCFYAALLGMLFAYVYCLTGRIIYPILLHMMVNFVTGFLSLYVTDPRFETLESTPPGNPTVPEMIYSVGVIVLAVLGLIIFFRNRKKLHFAQAGMELEKKEAFHAAFENAGFIVLFIYFLLSTIASYFSATLLEM